MATKEQVLASFQQNFSTQPNIYFSPGRINLIGEHIDYNDGFVMPTAIDKGIWFAIAANGSNNINLVSTDLNETFTTTISNIEKNESWKNYLLGVLHILQTENIPLQGFDCAFGGNLPVGAGLSSSAAVEGGLLYALNDIFSYNLNRVQMAQLAQKAEHSYAGVKCGIMDMFASLNGKKSHVILLDCNTLDYNYFPINNDEYDIVLINSKVHHSLASGEYNVRRKQCEEGLAILQQQNANYNSYRKIPSSFVEENKASLSNDVYRRCTYVTQEIERTQKAGELLKANDMVSFGKLMFATHEGLSKLYDVSCIELDFLVDEAKKHNDIIGSRLMGGGFGGCTINIIKKGKTDTIVQSILNAYQQKFGITTEAYYANTENGTHKIEA